MKGNKLRISAVDHVCALNAGFCFYKYYIAGLQNQNHLFPLHAHTDEQSHATIGDAQGIHLADSSDNGVQNLAPRIRIETLQQRGAGTRDSGLDSFGVGCGQDIADVSVSEIEKNGIRECQGKNEASDLGEVDKCDCCETFSHFFLFITLISKLLPDDIS